jgi:cobyrinic acid a,c-diamide synthase
VDAVYAGGGFPEVYAARLSDNAAFRQAVARAVAGGLPVYAECGGLMYLAERLRAGGTDYPMAGALPLAVEQTARPQGHGYVRAVVEQSNPFFAPGTELSGHEFHYSRILGSVPPTALRLVRGTGLGAGRDAVVVNRVWASYLHVHALGTPAWAPALVAAAVEAARQRTTP